jgi:hypothetical protein
VQARSRWRALVFVCGFQRMHQSEVVVTEDIFFLSADPLILPRRQGPLMRRLALHKSSVELFTVVSRFGYFLRKFGSFGSVRAVKFTCGMSYRVRKFAGLCADDIRRLLRFQNAADTGLVSPTVPYFVLRAMRLSSFVCVVTDKHPLRPKICRMARASYFQSSTCKHV